MWGEGRGAVKTWVFQGNGEDMKEGKGEGSEGERGGEGKGMNCQN